MSKISSVYLFILVLVLSTTKLRTLKITDKLSSTNGTIKFNGLVNQLEKIAQKRFFVVRRPFKKIYQTKYNNYHFYVRPCLMNAISCYHHS